MERFINAQVQVEGKFTKTKNLTSFSNPKIEPCEFTPKLLVASIDIETGQQNSQLYSIAVHLSGKEEVQKVFIVSDEKIKLPDYIEIFKDEKDLLQNFLQWFKEKDPDIIIGWHVIGFDLMFLERKCNELMIPFDIARAGWKSFTSATKTKWLFCNSYRKNCN